MPIRVSTEGARGCGYRKPGGLYLVSDGVPRDCGRFPITLDVCPCCSAGIKPSRGWTWVDGDKLIEDSVCLREPNQCARCPMARKIGKCGLLWIGEAFYKTPEDFNREALQMGISRRIATVPNDFIVGQTRVLLAHRKAITEIVDGKEQHTAAIFSLFTPRAIEYIVKGDETPEDIKALEKRGLTPVIVKRAKEQEALL